MALNAYKKVTVITNDQVAPGVYRMVVGGDHIARPGQFYMLKGWQGDPLLPRPLSVSDNGDQGLVFLYQVVGKGTGLLSDKEPGDQIEVLGPRGSFFNTQLEGKSALVAGGIGIAPLLYLAKRLPEKPDLYAGFRSDPYYIEAFEPYVDQIHIATEDGSFGHKGFVTDMIQDRAYAQVYACGPTPMLKSLKAKCPETPTYLSMENHMACGFGACRGCAIETTKGMLRVCYSGPVFPAEEVIL